MSEATTDSFLDGQGIPVALPQIEAELAKLWGPAAEQIGGPDVENPHVTRIVLANLVLECLGGDGESLGPVLETVIARFPCRAIVVRGSTTLNAISMLKCRRCATCRHPGCPRCARSASCCRPGPRGRPRARRGPSAA